MNIHHPLAPMHSVRASVNVPQSCNTCSFRAHFSAAFSCRSYLARLAFMGPSHIRVHSYIPGGAGFHHCDKTWERVRFQDLLFTNLVKSNIECISNIPLQFSTVSVTIGNMKPFLYWSPGVFFKQDSSSLSMQKMHCLLCQRCDPLRSIVQERGETNTPKDLA